ncbi:MAG: hypothetical protein K2M19_06695 [Muribaculaceae bacterium]|nr:hypothetical protein [Muribaculaceae bacterium]
MNNSRRPLIISLGAVVILIVLSSCPWAEWSGGRLKDFHLFADLMPQKVNVEAARRSAAENVDPELLAYVDRRDSVIVHADSVAEVVPDTLPVPVIERCTEAPRRGDVVLIEDYSPEGDGLSRLKSTLSEASGRTVRIAMVGDSYIEGDILAQDIRAGLQRKYGGRGVGYVPAFTNFPGFRGSVVQSGAHWEEREIRKMNDDPLRTILGTYFIGGDGAFSRYKGSASPDFVDYWTRSTIVFSAPREGTLTFHIAAEDSDRVFKIEPSSGLQAISVPAVAKDLKITAELPGIKVAGVWLDSSRGIVFDDISLRGNSGISHRQLDASTTAQMRQWIDYDLIILEFGMNALSAAQKDYTAYGKGMEAVVMNLKSLYPNAQILVMGVGDRGTKIGTGLGSMPTVAALVDAQRAMAHRTGSLFYDTRAAMGGDGAAVDWNRRRLLNSDYVHLNHKGGAELAEIFLESLNQSLQ